MFRRAVSEIVNPALAILTPDDAFAAALSLMREKGVSCVLAVAEERVAGILTERDVVKALAGLFDPGASLRSLMSRPVSGIMKDLSVEDACRMLTDGEIRHLAVMDHKGAVMGYISNSNVVDALAVEFMVENILCSEVMNPRVVTAPPDAPLSDVLKIMVDRRIGSVVVASGGKPAGVVTERDLTWRAHEAAGALDRPVSAFMTSPAVCVPPEGMVYKIILYMRQKSVRRVVVVDGSGLITGILTLSDMVKFHPRFL